MRQFFEKIASRMRSAIAGYWKRITANLSFRTRRDQFQFRTLLANFGKDEQVSKANLNEQFQDGGNGLRIEQQYYPNTDMCTLHISEPLINTLILTFEGPGWQLREMTPMVKALFEIKGVAKVTLQRYEVMITKARVFSWEEILPSAEEVLRQHLAEK